MQEEELERDISRFKARLAGARFAQKNNKLKTIFVASKH